MNMSGHFVGLRGRTPGGKIRWRKLAAFAGLDKKETLSGSRIQAVLKRSNVPGVRQGSKLRAFLTPGCGCFVAQTGKMWWWWDLRVERDSTNEMIDRNGPNRVNASLRRCMGETTHGIG